LAPIDVPVRKVLIAVDGSKPSLAASEHAILLAAKYKAELIVIHVVSPDVRYGYLEDVITPGLPASLKEVVHLATEKGQQYLDEVQEHAAASNLEIHTEVLIGATSVVKEIVQYAEEHEIDLIVVGTRGISGIKKMLLGSTASGVLSYAHCPVLVVK
jgi:nucleotide-binding universal stress UspA family protein